MILHVLGRMAKKLIYCYSVLLTINYDLVICIHLGVFNWCSRYICALLLVLCFHCPMFQFLLHFGSRFLLLFLIRFSKSMLIIIKFNQFA